MNQSLIQKMNQLPVYERIHNLHPQSNLLTVALLRHGAATSCVHCTFFSQACGPDVDRSSELRTCAPVEPVKKPGTILDWAQASTFQTHSTLVSAALVWSLHHADVQRDNGSVEGSWQQSGVAVCNDWGDPAHPQHWTAAAWAEHTGGTGALEHGSAAPFCCLGKNGSLSCNRGWMNTQRRSYLFLCAVQHADGLDVVGVLSQSPLSFDSFIHGLTNVHRLRSESRSNNNHKIRPRTFHFKTPAVLTPAH